MNIAISWMTAPRNHSLRPISSYAAPASRMNCWLYRTEQVERDESLLRGTIYSDRICANVGTPRPITFGTRAAFARTFR